MIAARAWAARAGVIAVVLLAASTVVAVRALVSSMRELERAELLRESGDVEDLRDAILHYRRAAAWWVPGTPHAPRALDALAAIAEAAERAGRPELALAAWRAIRSAIMGARAPLPPYPARLDRADAAIARLSGADPRLAAPGAHPLLGLAAVAGVALFAGGAFGLFAHGFDASGRLRRRAALRWAAVLLTGAVAAALGLALA